ncbi:hypothetical protein DIPPA_11839 [Diplonema papillatum]|nr:hypothetical protein DIPPA_11839 [Diplonema papillatum]
MIVLTVLLAKGVPPCTSVVLRNGLNEWLFSSESSPATPEPVWGFNVRVDPARSCDLAFDLLDSSTVVGSAAMVVESSFGHEALPVDPRGSLLVSWSASSAVLEQGDSVPVRPEGETLTATTSFESHSARPSSKPPSAAGSRPSDQPRSAGSTRPTTTMTKRAKPGGTHTALRQILAALRDTQDRVNALSSQQTQLELAVAAMQ